MTYGVPNMFALAMIWGWPLIALSFFLYMPARRAVLTGYIVGWLFLPMLSLRMPFLIWDKPVSTSVGALLGVLLMDTSRLLSFRLRLLDLPMILWCLAPLPASVTNSISLYDAASGSATQFFIWGAPYLIGRLYFSDFQGLNALATAAFVAGLVYVPFCLYEIRMSPQLNLMTYGYQQHDFAQTAREGGWRPIVFLQHGLAVGMLMTTASVCGVWLVWSGALKRVWNIPIWVAVGAVLITNIFLRATGAAFLMAAGIGVLFATRHLRTYALVVALCMAPVGYMAARAIGGWDGELAVRAAALIVGEDRAMSLEFRLINEQMLLERASLRRMFGWGTQGGSLIKDPEGEIISVPDGLWVIAIGTMGLLGLGAFYGATLLPILLLRRRARPVTWDAPLVAGASALAVALALHAIDNLFNAMANPFFLLAMGGLTGLAADARQTLPADFTALSRPVPSQSFIATAPRMPVPAVAVRPARAPDASDDALICEDLPERPPEAS